MFWDQESMTATIPRNFTKFEDTLFLGMTAKQIGLIGAAGVLTYILVNNPVIALKVKVGLASAVMTSGGLAAFSDPQGISTEELVQDAISFAIRKQMFKRSGPDVTFEKHLARTTN